MILSTRSALHSACVFGPLSFSLSAICSSIFFSPRNHLCTATRTYVWYNMMRWLQSGIQIFSPLPSRRFGLQNFNLWCFRWVHEWEQHFNDKSALSMNNWRVQWEWKWGLCVCIGRFISDISMEWQTHHGWETSARAQLNLINKTFLTFSWFFFIRGFHLKTQFSVFPYYTTIMRSKWYRLPPFSRQSELNSTCNIS